jgi:hypothetical protein
MILTNQDPYHHLSVRYLFKLVHMDLKDHPLIDLGDKAEYALIRYDDMQILNLHTITNII